MINEKMLEFICLSEYLFNYLVVGETSIDDDTLANLRNRYDELASEFSEQYKRKG